MTKTIANFDDNRTAEEVLDNVKTYLQKINKVEKDPEAKRIIKEIAYIIKPLAFASDKTFDQYMLERLLL
jgi:hypothetical protein